MKTGQIALVGMMACLLGCAGIGAYVPDEGGETNNQCSDISLSSNTSPQVFQGSDDEEILTVTNGQIQTLHSRAPGDATVTLTSSGAPAGLAVEFENNQTTQVVTVPLDNFISVDLNFIAGPSTQTGTYPITLTATESGCTPVSTTVNLTVLAGG